MVHFNSLVILVIFYFCLRSGHNEYQISSGSSGGPETPRRHLITRSPTRLLNYPATTKLRENYVLLSMKFSYWLTLWFYCRWAITEMNLTRECSEAMTELFRSKPKNENERRPLEDKLSYTSASCYSKTNDCSRSISKKLRKEIASHRKVVRDITRKVTYIYGNAFYEQYDNECLVNPKLIEEIASYKNVTKHIMETITQGWGDEMYQQYTEFIDKFGPRPSGSETLEAAIDHMINLTACCGVHEIYTETVDVPRWKRGEESIDMITPQQKKIALLGLGYSVETPPEGITAEVIVVKSFDDFKKLKNKAVRGKIVLFNARYTTYGDTVIYRSQSATRAAKKGAVASLVRSITPFSLYIPHTGAQGYGDNVTMIPTAAITLEDADLMSRLQDEGKKIEINLKMRSTLSMEKSRNTIVDRKGRVRPDKYVIVSGHIDSWDVGQGAIDDGGGMMISWFTPIVLKRLGLRPRRTVRAMLWTAEEMGLIGSAAYLARHRSELSDINFMLESDEGTFKPLGLVVGGSQKARCMIAEVLKLFSPIDKMTESDSPGSDLSQYVKEGVPGASLLNENSRYFWYHHTDADTLTAQNKVDVIKCAAFFAAVSYVIADLSEDIPRE